MVIDPFPSVPLKDLPPIDELTKDHWFLSRFQSEVEGSDIAKQLLQEGFRLDHLVTQALLSFHRDGKKPAEARGLGMKCLAKRSGRDLRAIEQATTGISDVELLKQSGLLKRELKHKLDEATKLSKVKHFGVTWQAIWLVILKKQIAARTGWEPRKVMKAIEALVTIAMRCANVQPWFGRKGERRLGELIASSITDFENDQRHDHTHLLKQLDSIPQRHRELFPHS
jgi:hypothetical protein